MRLSSRRFPHGAARTRNRATVASGRAAQSGQSCLAAFTTALRCCAPSTDWKQVLPIFVLWQSCGDHPSPIVDLVVFRFERYARWIQALSHIV